MNKGPKTTAVAAILGIILITMIVLFVLDVITMEELKDTLSVTSPIAILVIGWFAKDKDKTHTI